METSSQQKLGEDEIHAGVLLAQRLILDSQISCPAYIKELYPASFLKDIYQLIVLQL